MSSREEGSLEFLEQDTSKMYIRIPMYFSQHVDKREVREDDNQLLYTIFQDYDMEMTIAIWAQPEDGKTRVQILTNNLNIIELRADKNEANKLYDTLQAKSNIYTEQSHNHSTLQAETGRVFLIPSDKLQQEVTTTRTEKFLQVDVHSPCKGDKYENLRGNTDESNVKIEIETVDDAFYNFLIQCTFMSITKVQEDLLWNGNASNLSELFQMLRAKKNEEDDL